MDKGEKPKRDREVEGLLRQFLNTDGPKGNAKLTSHDAIFCTHNLVTVDCNLDAKLCTKCRWLIAALDGRPVQPWSEGP